MRVRSELREVELSETEILFLDHFSLTCYEVFVSTEDAASGIYLPDMQKKGLERKRNVGFQSNF
jgi:hypothetical protein